MSRHALVALVLLAAAAGSAAACLWDHDTLQEESLKQKDTAEVVTGKLRKHSDAFYRAKVAYTQALIDRGQAPKERYDDLAVAHAKLGDYDDALATLAAKEKAFPGEYTTEANLGTVLAMKGDLSGAIAHLEAALKIDPSAHFGREKYQVELLRWANAGAKASRCGNVVGLDDDGQEAAFVLDATHSEAGKAIPQDAPEAIQAMTGLIRFGSAEGSAVVWYNLGVALAWHGDKQLAVRALRRAELLGHPCAVEFGTPVARSIHQWHGVRSSKIWSTAAAAADAEWKKGGTWETANQKKEDALLKRKPKQAFGY